jgi:MFS transporter, FLVCR family, disrupted in renal carcinoma protein 2
VFLLCLVVDVSRRSNWGPIAYMIAFIPTSYFFDVFGLRVASLVAAILVAAGCAVRLLALTHGSNDLDWHAADNSAYTCAYLAEHHSICESAVSADNVTAAKGCPIACDSSAHLQVLVWMHFGQFLNGLAGPVAMMSGPVLSAAWFPPSFRTTSTAIVAISNGLGVAFSNYVGPALVPAHAPTADQQKGMAIYMWGSFAVSFVIVVAVFVYFPNRPPNAPSVTATIARTDFSQGVKDLFRHRNWWLLATSYGVMTGISSAWSSILALDLQPIFYDSDAVAAIIGLWGGIAGQVTGVLLSMSSDFLGGRKRAMLIGLSGLSVALIAYFTILCERRHDAAHSSESGGSDLGSASSDPDDGASWVFYAVPIALFACQGACFPIFYEMGVETAFPIAEGTSMGVLTFLTNIFSLIFLGLPGIGVPMGFWVNWAVTGGCAYGLIAVLLFREEYSRSDIDQGKAPATASAGSIQAQSGTHYRGA